MATDDKNIKSVRDLLENKRKEANEKKDWDTQLIQAVHLFTFLKDKKKDKKNKKDKNKEEEKKPEKEEEKKPEKEEEKQPEKEDNKSNNKKGRYVSLINEAIRYHICYIATKIMEQSGKNENSSEDEMKQKLIDDLKLVGGNTMNVDKMSLGELVNTLHLRLIESEKQMNSLMTNNPTL
jgi:hypothetical protein